MLQTIVERSPADTQGDDIVDSLLTTSEAQIARGRAEINYNCSNRKMSNCNLSPAEFVKPTSIIQVTDIENGPIFGIVNSFSLNFSISDRNLSVSASLIYETENT